MGANLDKYLKLKRRVDEARQKADRAEGAEKEVMNQIKNEFGCDSLIQSQRKRKQLKRQMISSKEEFDTAVEQFEKDWPEVEEEEEEERD